MQNAKGLAPARAPKPSRLGPIDASYSGAIDTHPTGRRSIMPSDVDATLAPWTIDGWKTAPTCAIAGACLTGEHTTPEPEPVTE